MALCHITGTVYLPSGEVAANRIVEFYKISQSEVTADYLGAVTPEVVKVRLDASGQIDVHLITANYYGDIFDRNGKNSYRFKATVPEQASAQFSDIIEAADPVLPLPAWLQQAFDARDEAQAAEAGAEEAADRAEEWAKRVTPVFATVGTLAADTTMSASDFPVGSKVVAGGMTFTRVSSAGDVLTLGGLSFNQDVNQDGTLSIRGFSSTDATSANLIRLVDRVKSQQTSQGGPYLGLPGVNLAGKRVLMTSGLVLPWYVKIKGEGVSVVEAEGMSSASGALFRVNSQGTLGPFLRKVNGNWNPTLSRLYIHGPGATSALTALDVGESTAGTMPVNSGSTKMTDLYIQGFGVGLNIRGFDTYLNTYEHLKIDQCDIGIRMDNGSNVNSGERMAYKDGGIAGGSVGIYHNSVALNWNILNTSIDFMRSSALKLGTRFSGSIINFNNCHLEESNDIAFIHSEKSEVGTGIITIDDTFLVPNTTKDTIGVIPVGGRPDGDSNPFQPLFKGFMNLQLDGVTTYYSKHCHGATSGVFMCDDNVNLRSVSGLSFVGWRQSPSKKFIANENWNFSGNSVGDNYDGVGIAGFFRSDAGGQAVTTISDTISWDIAGSGKSIKVESLANGGFATFETTPVPITKGQVAMPMAVFNLSETVGPQVASVVKLRFYGDAQIPMPAVSTISNTVDRLVFAMAAPHGLSVGDRVTVSATGSPYIDRVHRVIEVVSDTVFRVLMPVGFTALPLTAVISRTTTTLISETPASGDNLVGLYNDTDYQGYTGNRNWWCRQRTTRYGDPIPDGASYVTAVFDIGSLTAGDTVYIGAMMLSVLGA